MKPWNFNYSNNQISNIVNELYFMFTNWTNLTQVGVGLTFSKKYDGGAFNNNKVIKLQWDVNVDGTTIFINENNQLSVNMSGLIQGGIATEFVDSKINVLYDNDTLAVTSDNKLKSTFLSGVGTAFNNHHIDVELDDTMQVSSGNKIGVKNYTPSVPLFWEEVDTSDFVSGSASYQIKNFDKDNYYYHIEVTPNVGEVPINYASFVDTEKGFSDLQSNGGCYTKTLDGYNVKFSIICDLNGIITAINEDNNPWNILKLTARRIKAEGYIVPPDFASITFNGNPAKNVINNQYNILWDTTNENAIRGIIAWIMASSDFDNSQDSSSGKVTYSISQSLKNYWNGKLDLGALDNYYTSSQVDSLLTNYATSSALASETTARENADTLLQDNKQDNLVSGVNIKTVGGNTLLGNGDIPFPTYTAPVTSVNTKTGAVVIGISDIAGLQTNIATLQTNINAKQDALVSTGPTQNIKTINDTSLLGTGNITINSENWLGVGASTNARTWTYSFVVGKKYRFYWNNTDTSLTGTGLRREQVFIWEGTGGVICNHIILNALLISAGWTVNATATTITITGTNTNGVIFSLEELQ